MSRTRLLAIGIALLVAADLVLALLPAVSGGVALGVVLWGLHMGLTQGLLATLGGRYPPPELRGTAYGLFNLIGGLAMLAASVIAGGSGISRGRRGRSLPAPASLWSRWRGC